MICKVCQKEIDIEKELNRLETENERELITRHEIHVDCFYNTKRVNNFDVKDKKYQYIKYRSCPHCNKMILVTSGVFICSHCGKSNRDPVKHHHICGNPKCRYEEIDTKPTNNWICPKCGWKPSNLLNEMIHHHICENCGFEQDSNNANWTCPECHWNSNTYYHICPECGTSETTRGSTWVCPNCKWTNHAEYKHLCPECGNFEITNNSNWVCSKCGYQGTKYNHKCRECGYEERNGIPVNM